MAYIVQQRDIEILRQANRQLYAKVELLNHDMKIIDSLEGYLISDSFSIDAESDIRRTYTCELFVKDSSFLIGSDKKIWIDKYIRPYVGIMHNRSRQIVWYSQGTYVFNDTNYNYDVQQRTLSLTCSDLMCTLTGERGGYIQGFGVEIPEGSYIRNVIISLLNDIGITKYRVEDIGKTIPFDLQFSVGTTYYQVLKEVVSLYAGYEMFFDLDGTFIVQPIPTTKHEVSVLDSSVFTPLVISEGTSNTFNNVYNVTQVWGMTIDTEYYSTQVSSADGIKYNATIEGVTELENFCNYGIRIPRINGNNPTLNINGLGHKKIYEDNNTLVKSNRFNANTDYVFKYRKATNDFLLLGQYQAYGEYKLMEGKGGCPFSVPNLGYEIVQVLHFDNLNSDSLCEQRAKYETWLATRMKDTITLTMLSIPFLDVNWKVSYTSYMTNETKDYIVKSISGSNSESTMTVTMIEYSELYPDIIPTTN